MLAKRAQSFENWGLTRDGSYCIISVKIEVALDFQPFDHISITTDVSPEH